MSRPRRSRVAGILGLAALVGLPVVALGVLIALMMLPQAEIRAQEPDRDVVEPLPLKEDPDPWVERLCWRLPGCPLSVIFLAPLIAVGAVISAGARHPAMIALAGGAAFAGFLILLDPNPFSFLMMLAVAGAAFMLWRLVRV